MQSTTRVCATISIIALSFILLVIEAPPTWANQAITVDPAAYTGRYRVAGGPYQSGVQTISLPAGTHTINLASGQGFQIQVDAAGSVASLNPAAASGSGSSLQFNTTTMTVDPMAYTGTYRISKVEDNEGTGIRHFVVLPGVTHYVLEFVAGNAFLFDVDTSGNIVSRNAAAATGIGSTLRFNPVVVTIDPAAYTGTFRVSKVDETEASGVRSLTLLPGVSGYVLILVAGNGFRFDVDAAGNVTSQIPAAATGTGSTLRFSTTSVTVDADAYSGTYYVLKVDQAQLGGTRNFTVILGLTGYVLQLVTGNAFRFDVDAAGNVTSQVPAAAEGVGATLRFKTTTVLVNPTDYTDVYRMRAVDDTKSAGERCFTVLPGVSGYILILASGRSARFDVDALGNPTPPTLLINDVSETRTFELAPGCGNEPPTADAGPDQSLHASGLVTLDGSASFDDQTTSLDLAYNWSFASRPIGSNAVLSGALTDAPTFTADVLGTFEVQLVVTDDEGVASLADTVVISSENMAPTADAGLDVVVHAGDAAVLDGGGSADPDMDSLSFQWVIVSAPAGSTSALDDATSEAPTLTPDVEGTYVLSLVVNDGFTDSAADEVTVTAIGPVHAQELLLDACELIAAMPDANFDAKGHRKSLCNEIARILKFIKKADYEKADDHLAGLIGRVDGCAERGIADAKGAGQTHAADHIVDCDDQLEVYDLIVAARDAL